MQLLRSSLELLKFRGDAASLERNSKTTIADVVLLVQGMQNIYIPSLREVNIDSQRLVLDNEESFRRFNAKLRLWMDRRFHLEQKARLAQKTMLLEKEYQEIKSKAERTSRGSSANSVRVENRVTSAAARKRAAAVAQGLKKLEEEEKECTFQPNAHKFRKSRVISKVVTQNLYKIRKQVKERRPDSPEYEAQKNECTFTPKIGRAGLRPPRLHGMPKIPPPISNMLSFTSRTEIRQDQRRVEAVSPRQFNVNVHLRE